jgi:hypothetical protein
MSRALLRVACTPVIRIEAPASADHVGLLAPGTHPPPQAEETSGASPPRHSRSPGALPCTRAPAPCASGLRPVRSCGTGSCRRHPHRASRPWRPSARLSGSASKAWAPGTWLADRCAQAGRPVVLGHALSMHAIPGRKAQPATIAAHQRAVGLRGGMLPQASVSPAAMRAPRDLRRRRTPLLRPRAGAGRRAPRRCLGRRRPPHRRAAIAPLRALAPPYVWGAGRSRRHLHRARTPAHASERRHRQPTTGDQLPLTG